VGQGMKIVTKDQMASDISFLLFSIRSLQAPLLFRRRMAEGRQCWNVLL